MKRIHFRGIKQETKAQRKKRLQREFLDNYYKFQEQKKLKKKTKHNLEKEEGILNSIKIILGL
tara:strand:+ start:839 stop:1027 length:189 start_codon:yes stop_codon:yes gene_type:complete